MPMTKRVVLCGLFFLTVLEFWPVCPQEDFMAAGARAENPSSLQEARLFLRAQLHEALEAPEKPEQLVRYIHSQFSEVPDAYPAVILAYYGTCRGLQAKFSGHPRRKLAGLVDCLTYLDQAVQREDADLEVFFLRYSSLHHLPPLLGVPKKRVEDIEKICVLLSRRDYSVVDRDFQAVIVDFMLDSRRLNPRQRGDLQRLRSDM